MADKRTLVTSNHQCEIVTVKGEEMLKIKMTGISFKNYVGNNTTYADVNHLDLYLPLEYMPYLLRQQRETISLWKKRKLEYIDRITGAYNNSI
jgi:hypothetical protein